MNNFELIIGEGRGKNVIKDVISPGRKVIS